MTTILEICVESAAGARVARDGGADRVELCAALALGGVTPSAGIVAAALEIGLPVHVLVRPRAGDFVYDADDAQAVLADIRNLAEMGVAGVVVGAALPDGTLDLERMGAWRDAARDIAMTLHRAIDLCADPVEQARRAAELGVDRILTSGGAPTALEGSAVIAAMVAAVGSVVEVMAGSAVAPGSVRAIVKSTGVGSVHASARTARPWHDPRVAVFGFGGPDDRMTDEATVRALRTALYTGQLHS